ncbi:MAG: universal stress protein [Flavobacteriaceae bacterium]|jgi:nucleotide-binding universal stress UspA family protein|nr:universal stress protein [Flavobacteriaceae bacterium]
MAQKILVPIDFSDFNKTVIEHAIEHAKLVKGQIYLIHVATLDIGVIVSETGFTYLPELEETALNEEAEQMSQLKEEIESQGILCETIVKQGIPADIIVQEAKDLNADLIVIGSLGHNALYNMFIGSVASDVIKHSSVPLLVVPKQK